MAAPTAPEQPPAPLARRFTSLGGACEIYALDVPAERLAEGEAWVHRLHDRLTRFEPASELARFNASAGEWTRVSPELEALLRLGLRAFDLSDGLVHIGALGALEAAGYTRDFESGPRSATGPVGALRPLDELLEVRAGTARLAPGASVDLGGIAKGWMADRLCERIGPTSLVNLAGDLFARGAGPGGDGWPVGFGGETVLLHDMGAATSGSTKRAWIDPTHGRLHHLIDPRTGWPATTDLREASVLAHSGANAEIYAKTAFLLGRDAGARWLKDRAADCLGLWMD